MSETLEKITASVLGVTVCCIVFVIGASSIYLAYHVAEYQTTASHVFVIGLGVLGILLMGKAIAALGRLGWAIEELVRERSM